MAYELTPTNITTALLQKFVHQLILFGVFLQHMTVIQLAQKYAVVMASKYSDPNISPSNPVHIFTPHFSTFRFKAANYFLALN